MPKYKALLRIWQPRLGASRPRGRWFKSSHPDFDNLFAERCLAYLPACGRAAYAKLNGDDYFLIDSYVNQPNAVSYIHGDFDYNGVINGDDYFLIDSNFPQQGLPL